jgi:carbonic anhydrase
MSVIDELKAAAENNPDRFPGAQPAPPSRKVAVVTCMDARIDVYRVLGLSEGEAHVIRNAGGVVTADVLRSLAISQRVLGTREVFLMHHTRCGLIEFDAEGFRRSIVDETGVEPQWEDASIPDLYPAVRAAVAQVKADRTLPVTDPVRGFVYDVETGAVREIF